MGPSETKALEVLLAMSRGKTFALAIEEARDVNVEAILKDRWDAVHASGSLTVKGQDLARLAKDTVAYLLNYAKTPRPN